MDKPIYRTDQTVTRGAKLVATARVSREVVCEAVPSPIPAATLPATAA